MKNIPTKDVQYIYEQTKAGIFYDKSRKSWCALWLSKGHENRVYFRRDITTIELIAFIKDKQA